MGVVYRNRDDNALMAGLAVSSVLIPAAMTVADATIPAITRTWIGVWGVVWAAVFVIRGLHRGVTVDSTGATKRARSEKSAGVFSRFGGLLGLVVGAVMRHDWRQRLR